MQVPAQSEQNSDLVNIHYQYMRKETEKLTNQKPPKPPSNQKKPTKNPKQNKARYWVSEVFSGSKIR